MEQNTDDRLWKVAKKRAEFKRHLTTYFVMSLFFWAVWWFTQGQRTGFRNWAAVWPIWPMLFWGLGIAFQYFNAYGHTDRDTLIRQEYDKLKRQEKD